MCSRGWSAQGTTRTHAAQPLSQSSCEHSLVSRFLSVASLISCLSCILVSCVTCSVSALLLSSLCPFLFVSFPLLSVPVSVSVPVCVCLYVCPCLSLPVCSCEESVSRVCKFSDVQRASGKKVNAGIRAPATARDLESDSRKSTSVGACEMLNNA